MAALTFFAYFFLGLGPGLAFFASFIAPKSFLVLLSLFSAFLWLTVLLIISAIFRGFYPISESVGSYAGVLVASVAIQEAVRHAVWLLHRRSLLLLDSAAASTGHRFALVDKLSIALAWGYGHGACHVVFFYLSLLPLTSGNGTYYLDVCPSMSLFLVGALGSLAIGMVLTAITVVSMDGYTTGNKQHVAAAPLVHLAVALISLGNFKQGGCLYIMPILVAIGLVSTAYALRLCWNKGVSRPAL